MIFSRILSFYSLQITSTDIIGIIIHHPLMRFFIILVIPKLIPVNTTMNKLSHHSYSQQCQTQGQESLLPTAGTEDHSADGYHHDRLRNGPAYSRPTTELAEDSEGRSSDVEEKGCQCAFSSQRRQEKLLGSERKKWS